MLKTAAGQPAAQLNFPSYPGWNVIHENEELRFNVNPDSLPGSFTIEGIDDTGIEFDTLGNFYWKPSFDLVDRVEEVKEFPVIFKGQWGDSIRDSRTIVFKVVHTNRAPVVNDLPVFYVRQESKNTYQFSGDFIQDPDGDPVVYRAIPSQMPERSALTAQGQFTWTPTRSQFASLRNNPLEVQFVVEDQPSKLETVGTLKIMQTQLDLPPEILMVPADTFYTVKEEETLNIKLYISDPNGDDNVRETSFVTTDARIPVQALKQNTSLQYEFRWTPDYDFVESNDSTTVEVIFFSLDASNNRVEKRVLIRVFDAENLDKKDALQYQKYRSNLANAASLIAVLDENQKQLNTDYKKARKGKQKRSILNATLGAATGFSPVFLASDEAKVVSGIGGTTVLTLNTLEATEVIGKSKDAIMDKIRTGIDIRNKVQAAGDEFARKYALKTERRKVSMDKDIEKLRQTINDQRIVLLELNAYRDRDAPSDKDIRDTFPDFADYTP